MEINPEVIETLKEFKINKSEGLLCLLGIYFKLDVDKVCPEEVIKAINLTKIVEKDYGATTVIKWNMSLFKGQETAFDWVKEWNDGFGRINPTRKESLRIVTGRMMDFFKKYPEWRKEDIIRARDAYFKTVKDPQYLKSSDKFIFEGIGAAKSSMLLTWCERIKGGSDSSNLKGKIIT